MQNSYYFVLLDETRLTDINRTAFFGQFLVRLTERHRYNYYTYNRRWQEKIQMSCKKTRFFFHPLNADCEDSLCLLADDVPEISWLFVITIFTGSRIWIWIGALGNTIVIGLAKSSISAPQSIKKKRYWFKPGLLLLDWWKTTACWSILDNAPGKFRVFWV